MASSLETPLSPSSTMRRVDDAAEAVPAASASASAASWPAIFAGAFVAVAASLILLALGSGLGFASISPWPGRGVSAATFRMSAAIWLIVTEWLSAALGGYIAGRLRARWVNTHPHEVFFRDTAHGLVTWSVATVVALLLIIGFLSPPIGGAARPTAEMISPAVSVASGGPATIPGSLAYSLGPSPIMTYGMDRLFRPASGSEAPSGAESSDPRFEAAHIIANAVTVGRVPDTDRAYLADLVAAHTGVSGAEAQRRVDDFISASLEAETQAKMSADAARRGAAEVSIYTALAMLIGAFIASVSAAIGGQQRDQHP